MTKKTILFSFTLMLVATGLFANQNIEVFPSTPYERYTIYTMLIIFWAGIAGLIVIIRMKLKEIERIQSMGIDNTEKEIPLLD